MLPAVIGARSANPDLPCSVEGSLSPSLKCSPCPHSRAKKMGCVFRGAKVFVWDTNDERAFLRTPKSFSGIPEAFWGYKKFFLTFSEVKGVSSIEKFFLTFWKVKSGKVQRSATQKKSQKQQQQKRQQKQQKAAESTNNRSRTSSSNLYKQQHK